MGPASSTTQICPRCKTAGPVGSQCLSCGYLYDESSANKGQKSTLIKSAAKFLAVLVVLGIGAWLALGMHESPGPATPTTPATASSSAPEPVASPPTILLMVGDETYTLHDGDSVPVRVPDDSHAVDVHAALEGAGVQLWTPHSTRHYIPDNGIGYLECTGKRLETVHENGVPTMRSVQCPATFTVRVELATE